MPVITAKTADLTTLRALKLAINGPFLALCPSARYFAPVRLSDRCKTTSLAFEIEDDENDSNFV
jgi:hypothetical protein